MFNILAKQNLSQNVKRLDIRAEGLVAKLRPGQFVAVMPDRFSRRIPFSVFEVDWRRKCVSIVFEEKDAETRKMGEMKINDTLFAVSGPFGEPLAIEKKGTVVCVGEGLGLASLVGLCRAMKQVGNKVFGIAGFDSRKSSILENQMRLNCTKFYVMYKDGMHERKGDVLMSFKRLVDEIAVDEVYVDVSSGMMRDICRVAADKGLKTVLNLMPLVQSRSSFFETDHLMLGGKRYYPAVDGVMLNSSLVDLKELEIMLNSTKEYAECRRKEDASWQRPSAFARLRKLVWG
ncbi:MAG: hypothetical protein HGA80_00875 [Candidatus Omnitrophica bacterium]|nr:hypothetical protein [Candidatus Omnitrophota bacterium]